MEPKENDQKYFEIFQRNIRIYSKQEQLHLKKSTILLAGTGGVGGPLAEILVRMGFGKLILADFDTYTLSNLNRQLPSTINDLGKLKAKVLAAHLKKIHPFTEIVVVPEGITKNNVDELVRQSDVVLQLMDGAMTMVLQQSLKKQKKIGFTGSPLLNQMMFTSFPPQGYYFSDIYPYKVDENDKERSTLLYITFFEVLSKKDFSSTGYAPVTSAQTFTVAGILAHQIALYLISGKIILPRFPAHAVFDAGKMSIKTRTKYLFVIFKIFDHLPWIKSIFIKIIKSKVERKLKNTC